jgi:hypothetical protein
MPYPTRPQTIRIIARAEIIDKPVLDSLFITCQMFFDTTFVPGYLPKVLLKRNAWHRNNRPMPGWTSLLALNASHTPRLAIYSNKAICAPA